MIHHFHIIGVNMVRHFEENQKFEREMIIHNLVCLVNGCANLKGWYIPAKISCVDDSYDSEGESEVTVDDNFTVVAFDEDGKEMNINLTDKEREEIKEDLVEYAEQNLF